MPNKAFALSYLFIENGHLPTTPPQVKLFETEEMAYAALYFDVAHRFVDVHSVAVSEYCYSNGVLVSPTDEDAISTAMLDMAFVNGYKAVIDILREWEQGESNSFVYSIVPVRTTSFMQEAKLAKGVVINGEQVDSFAVIEEAINPTINAFLSTSSMHSDGFQLISKDITHVEAMSAQYDFDKDLWVMDADNTIYEVSFIQ